MIDLGDLHTALAADEMIPYFQPIVELRTGRLSGFEVLARWEHPRLGAYLPINLIELAEGSGLITEVARQVFSKAFALVAAVPEPLRLSVNLSPVQLGYRDLVPGIEAMALSSGFPLSRLTIEITENALLSDLTQSIQVANGLKELGCRLSLDDFGIGSSSLAHLQALPFDELKIDRSFVGKMTDKRQSRKIVAAIIGLGHSLGLSTVAEGVETEAQAAMLLALGSELGQGWHYGRPAPFHAILALVAAPPHTVPSVVGERITHLDAVSSLEAFPSQRLAQLQAIYDGAPVGLAFLNCALRYVSMNQRLAEMNGAPVSAHLGRTVQEMVPELYGNVEPYLLRALRGEAIAGVEVPRPRPGTDAIGWILISYQPAFDETKEVIGISISVMDITELKQAREELRESEFAQRQLVELNQQIPWIMDPAGKDLKMSSSQGRSAPGSVEPPQNLGWLQEVHPDDQKVTERRMRRALRTGERIDMEYRIQGSDGEWRWMRSRGLPRFGPDGKITCWYGSVEDIDEKKRAEASAHQAEITLRALLKAVPVAIIIKEGKNRARRLSVSTPAKRSATSPSASRLYAEVGEHVFLESMDTAETEVANPEPSHGKRAMNIPFGLKIVDDVQHASEERERLIAMLKEFGEHRAQRRDVLERAVTN